jgi:ATP-dependent DNA helicase RecG
MTWKLDGPERAYEHFSAPFLLSTTALYQKIRNIQLRLLPKGQLVPHEIAKYDQKMVLEALHNCIAHQDYARHSRIVVIEKQDRLIFESEGGFFEGQPDDYSLGEKLPRRYRNAFLVEAMSGLNMIDKMGFGIHDMHLSQAKRYLPMPDYDLSDPAAVRLTIYGGVVDSTYTQMLMLNTSLSLVDVLALDRVQKKLPLPDDVVARLKRGGLIEGRKPNFHVSADVAKVTTTQVDYIRTRTQDDEFYAKLLMDYLKKFEQASRQEINQLLLDKLSDALTDEQKDDKVGNLLTKLRRHGRIRNAGSRGSPVWRLAE